MDYSGVLCLRFPPCNGPRIREAGNSSATPLHLQVIGTLRFTVEHSALTPCGIAAIRGLEKGRLEGIVIMSKVFLPLEAGTDTAAYHRYESLYDPKSKYEKASSPFRNGIFTPSRIQVFIKCQYPVPRTRTSDFRCAAKSQEYANS